MEPIIVRQANDAKPAFESSGTQYVPLSWVQQVSHSIATKFFASKNTEELPPQKVQATVTKPDNYLKSTFEELKEEAAHELSKPVEKRNFNKMIELFYNLSRLLLHDLSNIHSKNVGIEICKIEEMVDKLHAKSKSNAGFAVAAISGTLAILGGVVGISGAAYGAIEMVTLRKEALSPVFNLMNGLSQALSGTSSGVDRATKSKEEARQGEKELLNNLKQELDAIRSRYEQESQKTKGSEGSLKSQIDQWIQSAYQAISSLLS